MMRGLRVAEVNGGGNRQTRHLARDAALWHHHPKCRVLILGERKLDLLRTRTR